MTEQKQKITATCRKCGRGIGFIRLVWLHDAGNAAGHMAEPEPATIVKDPPDPPSEAEQITALEAENLRLDQLATDNFSRWQETKQENDRLKQQIAHLQACSTQHCARWVAAEERIQQAVQKLGLLSAFVGLLANAKPETVIMRPDDEVSIRCQFGQALAWHVAIQQALAILGANEINEREKEA